MKAISLHQPWATLIALGVKHYETRSWATNLRGPLAIHAAKRPAQPIEWPFGIRSELKQAGFGWDGEELPYGCIVCTVDLVDCIRTYDATTLGMVKGDERHFGDYTHGRYAWRLTNVQPVANIPARGSQGFWEWVPSGEITMVKPTHDYVGRCKTCGATLAAVYDMVDDAKGTVDAVAQMLRRGLEVERVPLEEVNIAVDGCQCAKSPVRNLPLFEGVKP